MINQVNTASGLTYKPDLSQKTASKKAEKKDDTYDSAFSVDISVTGGNKPKGSNSLTSDEIESIKDQAEQSAASLKNVVEKLILKQRDNAPAFSLSIEILGTSGAVTTAGTEETSAISENGDCGVSAVSDRIVSFAKSISGGDASKIEMLRDAIDKGFASVQKTLGGKLPEISSQTYDAVMAKLDDWASETETALTRNQK